jgi:N-acetyl-gamma-glutamyl-phosphate reductase
MNWRAGVVGFRGYSGAELVTLLSGHPYVSPVLLEHRADSAATVKPRRQSVPPTLPCTKEPLEQAGLAVAFLATPPEVSMELAPWILEAGVKVIDLSGAFRLGTAESYRRWYGEEHNQPGLLAEAVYGLPEFYRGRVPGARLVSNPGCYPTAANLALRPLVAAGLIERTHGVVCDAKSGVSGAGRKPSLKTHFCEVTENFSAYSILGHRHVPEVLMNSGLEEREFSFTAHLLPIHRGILETIYFQVCPGKSAQDVMSAYEGAYENEPFIRLFDPGQVPDIASVSRTNYCDIGFRLDEATGRCVVVAAIDNLLKGAAGQAVQNMNLLLGRPEVEGLL